MATSLHVTTERIDDFVLLLHVMMRLNLPAILNRHLPRHWLQQGLDWGWVTTIWLAHILSQGDHRKLTVRDWVRQARYTLQHTTGLLLRDTDFTDDRLTIVLRELSNPAYWHAIEQDLAQHTIRVYHLTPQRVRVDATTVSGFHSGSPNGLLQFGHSKDDPALRQVKVMLATLDPLGLPLATDVVPGHSADDPLYGPIIARVQTMLQQTGLLFVGDVKMSALATRAAIHAADQYYLCPLALTGATAEQLPTWVQAALDGQVPLTEIAVPTAEGPPRQVGRGYEFTRLLTAHLLDQDVQWTERVLVVYSPTHAARQQRGLEERLAAATAALAALTPPPGRGKRQISEEVALEQAIAVRVAAHRVTGLLTVRYERQVTQEWKRAGRGRPSATRPPQLVETVRYQITSVERVNEAIAAETQGYGWRAFVTDMPPAALSLAAAVGTYREEWQVERGFHRLKDAPLSIRPLYVQRDDQVTGLTHLLSLGVRVLSLIEWVVRRKLAEQGEELVGLHAENPKKGTARPTSERLLAAFRQITLTIITLPTGVLHHVTPLTPLQQRILELLDLAPDIYQALAENSA
jgi:transposase